MTRRSPGHLLTPQAALAAQRTGTVDVVLEVAGAEWTAELAGALSAIGIVAEVAGVGVCWSLHSDTCLVAGWVGCRGNNNGKVNPLLAFYGTLCCVSPAVSRTYN